MLELRQIKQKCSFISWGQHATFHEMIMMSRLHQTNMLSWIGILLVQYNNSPRVDHDNIILILSQPVFVLCPYLPQKQQISN